MRDDPLESVERESFTAPPTSGPGSGRERWIAFALKTIEANENVWRLVEQQSAAIRELQAEVELLRQQIASRKPKGGRPRLPDRRVQAIEADLAAGYTRRQAAVRNGVSHVTVQRIARRVAERRAVATGEV